VLDAPHGVNAIESYEATQLAADQARAAHDPEAAARLRDHAVATNPAADPEAQRLAGERLDDFRMSRFVGPLPIDPILGGDARSRARSRVDLQRRLEAGTYGLPPMTPDDATQSLDDGERFGRAWTTHRGQEVLVSHGMSPSGAAEVIRRMTAIGGPALAGAEKGLSAADTKALAKVAGRFGTIGDIVELGMGFNDWCNGGSHADAGGTIGSVGGGAAGAWAGALAVSSFGGPWTVAAVAIAGSLVGSGFGEGLGRDIGGQFDPVLAPAGGTSGRCG